ncbi:MAG: helix-turn-helix transcriptional regulator [Phycisphaerae bacterium]|nr:helix-turn-helix transcriptional regulator [Phycisphaerae bacterium]
MDLERIIANNIRYAREQAGYSQDEVRKHLGFSSHSAISDIEQAKRRVSTTELAALSELFGRSIDWFFNPDAIQEDTLVLARAEKQSPEVKRALLQAMKLRENYRLLEQLLNKYMEQHLKMA